MTRTNASFILIRSMRGALFTRLAASFVCVLTISILAACGPTPAPTGPLATPKLPEEGAPRTATTQGSGDPLSQRRVGPGFRLTAPEGDALVRVGLLLPMSGARADVGKSLFDAAQMALFEFNDPRVMLLPKDTGGTAAGAAKAAQDAVAEGAELLLGPVFAASVAAASPVAKSRGVPMVAFSTDRVVAGGGIFLLSFLPELEVERVTAYAVSEGVGRFAALIPDTEYGERVWSAYAQSVDYYGGTLAAQELYTPIADELLLPAQRIADFEARQKALQKEIGLLKETLDEDDPFARQALEDLEKRDTLGDVEYDAILLPEGGVMLRQLAPLLPYYDVDPGVVRFLGTGLWNENGLGREPPLVGGWFGGPPPASHDAFITRFETNFGYRPIRIASLAYDAVALAVVLADDPPGRRYSAAALTDSEGFAGVDGIFRLHQNGIAERGLAVLEVRPDGFRVVSPAPQRFDDQPIGAITIAPSAPAGTVGRSQMAPALRVLPLSGMRGEETTAGGRGPEETRPIESPAERSSVYN